MKVLFVCIENTCRSVMAETIFNNLAKRWKAESAGVRAGSEYDSMALEILKRKGYEVKNKAPKEINSIDLNEYELVVTVCEESACVIINHPRVERWDVEDPKGKGGEDYLKVFGIIEKKVFDLLRRLENEGA